MENYEARAFIDETHELLTKAAAGNMTEEEEDLVLALEKSAVKMLNSSKFLADFKIVRNDGAGPSDNPKEVAFNTINDVDSIEIQDLEKIIEFPNGEFKKLKYKRYNAIGKSYEVPDGETEAGHPKMRKTNDTVSSSAEGFIERGGEYHEFGGASALIARLLEAKAARLVK